MENTTTQSVFITRLKSFLWRLGSMVLVAGIAFATDNLELLHIAPQYQVLIGLVLGEITKLLNTPKQEVSIR